MICAIVLAAGRSERMGTQKLLLLLHGQPVIAGIVDEVRRSPVERIFVVVGRDAPQVEQALAGRNVTFIPNPNPNGDMLSSVRCGLRALPAECEAVLVVLGDQPGITSALIERLVRVFRASAGSSPNRSIVVPTHSNRRGHPLLFAAKYRDEILTGFDGVGLHGLLKAHTGEVLELPVSEPAVLEDLDTPEDYQRHSGAMKV